MYFDETPKDYLINKYKLFMGKSLSERKDSNINIDYISRELAFYMLEFDLNKNRLIYRNYFEIAVKAFLEVIDETEHLSISKESIKKTASIIVYNTRESYRREFIIYNLEIELMNKLIDKFIKHRLCKMCVTVSIIGLELLSKYNIKSKIIEGYIILKNIAIYHCWLETDNHTFDPTKIINECVIGVKTDSYLSKNIPEGIINIGDLEEVEVRAEAGCRSSIQEFLGNPSNFWNNCRNKPQTNQDLEDLNNTALKLNQILPPWRQFTMKKLDYDPILRIREELFI